MKLHVCNYCIDSSKSIDWTHTPTQKRHPIIHDMDQPTTVFAYKLKFKRNYLQKFKMEQTAFPIINLSTTN